MKTYRISVPVIVEVCIDIEACDKYDAECKYEDLDLDFSLQQDLSNGVFPADERLYCIAGEPNYEQKNISN